jgi:hypothetical protein
MSRRIPRLVLATPPSDEDLQTPPTAPMRLRRLRRRLFDESAEETSTVEDSEDAVSNRSNTWTADKRTRFDELVYLLGEIREQRSFFAEGDTEFSSFTGIILDLSGEMIDLFQ